MTNKDLTQGGNFAILPAHIRYNKDLTDSEKILFCEITALSNKNGYCYASNKYLSEIYGVSIDTISRRVNKLKKKGFVNVQLIKEKGSNNIKERRIYPSLDLPIGIGNPADRGIGKVAERGIGNSADRGIGNFAEDNNLSINNLNNNNLNNNKENISFEKWWKIYPKKTGSKKVMVKKFEKAIKEVGEDHLFKATEIYLNTVSEIQYVCGPEKFFNQKYYSEDAMETNKQILKEKGNNKKYNNNNYIGYDINKDLLEERKAKREADIDNGELPF